MREAELAILRALGAPEDNILIAQTNLANTYGQTPGRDEEALRCGETYTPEI